VVPAGWDSWGKIVVLRDGFEAKTWGEAWERDLESDNNLSEDQPGAKRLFGALVANQGVKVCIIFCLGAQIYLYF
jgi:dynein light intermediate chain 1